MNYFEIILNHNKEKILFLQFHNFYTDVESPIVIDKNRG